MRPPHDQKFPKTELVHLLNASLELPVDITNLMESSESLGGVSNFLSFK